MARFQSDLFRKNLTSDPRFDPMSDHGGEAPEDYFVEPLSEEERARIFDEPADRSVEKDEYKVETIPETPAAAIPAVAAPKPATAPKPVSVPKMTRPVLPAAVEEEPEAKEPAKEDKLPAVPSEFTREALAQAIAERRGLRGAKAISEAGAGIGAAIAGLGAGAVVKPGGNFDFLEKEAGEKVSDLAAKQKQIELMDERDPNSQLSVMSRDFIAGIAPNLKDKISGMSYGQLANMLPTVMSQFKIKAHAEEMALKRQDLKLQRDRMNLQKEETNRIRQTSVDARVADKLVKNLEERMTAKGSVYGKDADLINNATRLHILMDQYPDLDKMPPEFKNDVYLTFARIVTGGNIVSEHLRNDLTPSTWKEMVAKAEQVLSGKPVGAEMGKFLKIVRDSSDKEEAAAKQRVADVQKSIAIGSRSWAAATPNAAKIYNSLMLHKNIPLEYISNFDPEVEKLFESGRKAEKAMQQYKKAGDMVKASKALELRDKVINKLKDHYSIGYDLDVE